MAPTVDHVVVLMLENRSFDHMLGYLDHPSSSFDGLREGGPYENPGWKGGPQVATSSDAKYVLPVDPDHSHDAVMLQIGATGKGATRQVTNLGFVDSYERKGRNLAAPAFEGLLAPILAPILAPRPDGPGIQGRGPLIMRCQSPDAVPVLSTLALQFAVCTRWFCSVPGETWPNRNFAHAGTSDGTTVIVIRFYENPTIFELLERANKTWRIYYDDVPQVLAFKHLWDTPERARNWFRSADFAAHVAAGDLPHYSFIEPNHRPPVHISDPGPSDSQHPGNNQVANDQYDDYPAHPDGDFKRGEALIASVYEALRANRALFERTILVVTYDEHGGFYDHVPPPVGIPAPGVPNDPGVIGDLMNFFFRRKSASFDFTALGPRVPAVIVSPFIPPATVDTVIRDHATVPATLRALFASDHAPLTQRDGWAPPFNDLLTLNAPRTADLPDLSQYATPTPAKAVPAGPEPPIPSSFQDLVDLARLVDKELPGPNTVADGPRELVAKVADAFTTVADLARGE
jgi:phospholipase C